jgi:4-carboxymuconolactone decarboxylase
VIDRVRYDRDVTGLPDQDALVIEFGRALFRQHKIDAGLYRRVIEHFGQKGLVDLTLTLGDYVMTAFLLNAVDQQLPPGRTANLPARSTLGAPR